MTKEVTADAGTLTLTLADFNVTTLGQSTIVTETATHILTFTEVWNVTKVLRTFADLSLLTYQTNSRNTGYYILDGNINCAWGGTVGSTGAGWSHNNGFGGTLDGRGYTIDRFSVGNYGIFGTLGQATIKNLNIEMVTLNAGSPLFARMMYNSTIENVTVKLNAYNSTSGECGILVSRETNTSSVLRDITIDANGKDIYNVLGRGFNAGTTVENYVVNNANSITYYGTSDGNGATAIAKPEGLTTNVAATN